MDVMTSDNAEIFFTVTFRGKENHFTFSQELKLNALAEILESKLGAVTQTQKLLVPHGPKKQLTGFHLVAKECRNLTISDAGIKQGQKLRLVGATSEELETMYSAGSKDRTRSFEDEESRAAKLRQSQSINISHNLPQGPYTFHAFKTLEIPGVKLSPPNSQAMQLMLSLACDPGIVAVMKKHMWSVGIMTELAPVGYVGVSPKCLLGFNKNRGEEISLRLRTDDLRGFRKYKSIKETLLHELAHMVHDEHDVHFKTLNSQLLREAEQLDWTKGVGHTLSGHAGPNHMAELDQDWEQGAGKEKKGVRLGGAMPGSVDAKQAAALAAFRRLVDQECDLIDSFNDAEAENNKTNANSRSFSGHLPGSHNKSASVGAEEFGSESAAPMNIHSEECIEPEPHKTVTGNNPNKILKPASLQHEGQEHELEIGNSHESLENTTQAETSEQPVTHSLTQEDVHLMEYEDFIVEDEGTARLHAATGEAGSRFKEAVERLKREATADDVLKALQTVATILRNALQHPDEHKYKRLRKDNATFHKLVGRHPAAVEILMAAGFREQVGSALVLQRNDPGLLWLACSSVEASL